MPSLPSRYYALRFTSYALGTIMGLLAPLALVLLPLLAVVVVMYLLRLRRPETAVSSLFLWATLLRDQEANAPWQRLRANLLLLLQLLILLALILALARPWGVGA